MTQETQEGYRIMLAGGSGEIEEKKSRFIATLRPVETEEEAVAFIEEMKKKYWDARHNCSAYVLGERGEVMRYSDDGEPGGTAGRPMLEVLLGDGVRNAAVVVTRYFGGTLLGTGGLVRAYTQAVQEGLRHCIMGRRIAGVRLLVTTDYHTIGKILHLLGQKGISPEDSSYEENVRFRLVVPETAAEQLCAELTEAAAGKAAIEELERLSYTQAD
ncbi:MAG: YigZ family protein [Lachnospiraceae bacterium]|nr:YigZ family protein [Lachnospiraceae bacterium]MBD5483727.1 YigZ family protein [Lachnospiraceae bacterium]